MKVEEWLGPDNELGIKIWNDKYRYKNETFDEWLDRVSHNNADLKQLIIEKKFLFGGRILANRGIPGRKTYSNCYVLEPPKDSIESIFDTAGKLARTFSYGGGAGIDISKLAPRGAKVNNTALETSGAVSFTDLYSMVTGLIGQHGRRGALMLSIADNHPDLEEFIKVKTDLNRVTKANMSVRISDRFMQAVKSNKDWELGFYRSETDSRIEKTVKAQDVFKQLCDANYDYGEPGCLFWDTITHWNLLSECKEFSYAGTNPCLIGSTRILTKDGYIPIEYCADRETTVWNGYEWSDVVPKCTGCNQPVMQLKFSNGTELTCTPYHKFVLKDGSRVQAKDMEIGSKLIKNVYPVINGHIDDDLYTRGFFAGDGSFKSTGRPIIYLYGDKRILCAPYLDAHISKSDGRDIAYLNCDVFNKSWVPDTEFTVKARLSWLAGIIDSDGNVNSTSGDIQISSVDVHFLNEIRIMLTTLGCSGKVSLMRKGGLRKLPAHDENNTYREYLCHDSYRIIIPSSNVETLRELGLTTHRVPIAAHPQRNASRFVTLLSKENAGVADKVYCMNEPLNHTFIAEGVITSNCAEEPLPAGGSCLLGSLNLAAFVDEDGFDYGKFRKAVHTAVYALNDVLNEGMLMHPLKEQRECVRKWRQIGLGIMGLADAFIKMGIRYGSKESIEKSEVIATLMATFAIQASQQYSLDHPECNVNKYLDDINHSAFFENLEIKPMASLANTQLLTIAPTGSISTMIGVSGGIEPIFAKEFTRRTVSLGNKEELHTVHPDVIQAIMDKTGCTIDNLPDYVVTSKEIPCNERIDVQAMWQTYIDASISSTINLPEDTPRSVVTKLYMYAWEKKCKGITVFREGCKRDAILTTEEPKVAIMPENTKITAVKHTNKDTEDHSLIGKKRKLMTGCGSLHCVALFDSVTGDLKETYLNKGSTGGCNNFMVGLSRMMSLSARSGCTVDEIVDQLKSTGSCPSYAVRRATKGDTSKGSCCPMAIGNALIDMHDEIMREIEGRPKVVYNVKPKNPCPNCGAELEFSGGCNICKDCGWTKCD